MELRFSEPRADRAVRFFEQRLHHVRGRWSGAPLVLEDWQRDDIVRPLFGWERYSEARDAWVRRFVKAYIELPKKSGKSTLGAGMAGYGLYASGEGGPEVYSVAFDKKQAGIVFGTLADMVGMDGALRARSEVLRSRIAHHGVVYVPRTRGVYKVIPADAASIDGINPSLVVLDELHRQPGRELYDLLDQSFGARDEPLYIILSTAGHHDPTHVAWEVHDYALKVASGVVEDPTFFAYVRHATPEETEGDGWRSEKLWRRVNPALTSFNPGYLDEYRRVARESEDSPAKVASFKRLYLNVWLPRSAGAQDKLVDLGAWDRSAGLSDPEALRGATCYLAVDMASTTDLAALVALFPTVGRCPDCRRTSDCVRVLARFFLPQGNLERQGKPWAKALRETLRHWVAEGFITVSPGSVIDDTEVLAEIGRLGRAYQIAEVAKDPFQSRQLGASLEDQGVVVWDHGQSMERMASPTEEFIGLVTSGRLHHGGNPVLRWMVDNAVAQTDTEGRKKPSRRHSSGKIDGVVAVVMAIGAWRRTRDEPVVLEGPLAS